MKLMNALMPGEHNWMTGKPMPGQVQSEPLGEIGQPQMASPVSSPRAEPAFRRDRGPIMNALGGFFEFAAPEAYEAGRQKRFSKLESNALAGGKFDEASRIRMQAGDFEGGTKIAEYGQQQAAATRQQEAQKLVTVMSSAAPEQLTQLAMSDPAGFEQASGVSSEEYLTSMKRLMEQGGMDMQSAHQFVLQQAQAEAGLQSTPSKYGLDLKEAIDPRTGQKVFVQSSETGGVRPVEGFSPPSATPGYEQLTLADGEYEYIPGQPETLRKLGDSPVKTPMVSVDVSTGKGENKFQEGLGTQSANNFDKIITEGRAAGASIGNLDTMEALLDQIDYTGFGGDTLLQVQRAGAMLGIEIPDLPAKEAAKRLSSQMALSLKSDLPGPMSNADREFLLSIPPNLNSTAAGNDAILFILRKREERKQDMMQSLLQANPQSMEEYRAWENQYLETTPPMFTPATQSSLLKALSGASGADNPQ